MAERWTDRWALDDVDRALALALQEDGRASYTKLAELVGTTQSAIARLERGGRPPRIDTLLRIADALECDLVVELKPRRH